MAILLIFVSLKEVAVRLILQIATEVLHGFQLIQLIKFKRIHLFVLLLLIVGRQQLEQLLLRALQFQITELAEMVILKVMRLMAIGVKILHIPKLLAGLFILILEK